MPVTRPRILVVDDERAIRHMLRDVLDAFGYAVDVAAGGPEALAAFAPDRYDLVVTDLLMAGMSGIEVAQAIRSVDADVPLILLTGSVPGIRVEQARIADLTLLHKPIGLRDLQDAVARAIAQRRKGPARAEGRLDEPSSGALDERAG